MLVLVPFLHFSYFLSLASSPTPIIALDHDLDSLDVKFHCATKPSLFEYPPEQEVRQWSLLLFYRPLLKLSTISNTAGGGDKMNIDDNPKSSDETKDKKEEQTSA